MNKNLTQKYRQMNIGVRAGLWFTFCNLAQKGISFLVLPIFTRIMSQADYGIYNTYTSWYNFLSIFTSLGLSFYVFSKGMVKYENDRDEFVISIQSLSTTATLLAFVVYIILRKPANSLMGLTTTMMLCMFVHMLFEPSIEYWTARKRFEYDYKKAVGLSLGIAFLNPALGIIMVLSSSDTVIARVVSATTTITLFGACLHVSILRNGKKGFSTKYWKYALNFNIPLIPHFLASTALSQADRVMITNLVGPKDTALYSVAYALGMVTILFSNAIQQAILPWQYTKIKNNDYNKLPQVANITMLIIVGIDIAFIAFAPELVSIVAPESYMKAIWAMPPVCGSVFFMYLFNMFANIEYYFEESKFVAVASIVAALANIGLNRIFIPLFGYAAAGYTTLVCYILLAISHYICMIVICKKHNLSYGDIYDSKFVLLMSLVTVISVGLLVFAYDNLIIRYAIVVIICVTAFVFRDKLFDVLRTIRTKEQDN